MRVFWNIKMKLPEIRKRERIIEGKKLSDYKWTAIEWAGFKSRFGVHCFRMRMGDRHDYKILPKAPNESWAASAHPPAGCDFYYTQTTDKNDRTILIGRVSIFGQEQKPITKVLM